MSGGRIVLLIVGIVVALLGLAALAGGGVLLALNHTERDSAGFFSTGSESYASESHAIVSDDLDIGADGPDWLFEEGRLATVRVRAQAPTTVSSSSGSARPLRSASTWPGRAMTSSRTSISTRFAPRTAGRRARPPQRSRGGAVLGRVRRGGGHAERRMGGREGQLVGRRNERRCFRGRRRAAQPWAPRSASSSGSASGSVIAGAILPGERRGNDLQLDAAPGHGAAGARPDELATRGSTSKGASHEHRNAETQADRKARSA